MKRPRTARELPVPFVTLVAHFVRRMFASDEEQGVESVSLGLGAVLAILASPGAFASIFLMDKYSTLLQWVRGQTRFDPFRASVSDEYFFVVLSMTIIGLVMVLRWNRLLPDARDFANLAVLPIPIRNIFLANLAALLGLAVVFGIDVNAASAFLFPGFVTANGGFIVFARLAAAHAVTVFLACLFSFFAIFALVGVSMLVLPKRVFRAASIGMRMLLVIVLLSTFLSNLFLQLFSGRLPHVRELYMRWLPSYWFLGIYQTIAGLGSAATRTMATQAWIGLESTVVVGLTAYALCYQRHFRRLPELLNMGGAGSSWFRLKLPEAINRILFRTSFEHALIGFMMRVLLRSERHLMFVGGYFGVGVVLAAQMAADNASAPATKRLPNAEWLAVPLVLALFVITGLRFAFDIPAVFPANWLFRIGVDVAAPSPATVARRFMRCCVVPWVVLAVGPITAAEFGWTVAGEHVATIMLLSILLIDVELLQFNHIPFTYTTELDSRRLIWKILGPVFGALIAAPTVAGWERLMLDRPMGFMLFAAFSGASWYLLRRQKQAWPEAAEGISFAERSAASLELLKLS
jgi:hypothetical protein